MLLILQSARVLANHKVKSYEGSLDWRRARQGLTVDRE